MFRELTDAILVSQQIDAASVEQARLMGVTLIVNNRPEDESADQIPGPEIEAAARAAGLAYIAIPITHSGFSQPQVAAMVDALGSTDGRVLAYCRSGARSTNLWALAEASLGSDPDALSAIAANAGYDVTAVRPLMDVLKAQA
jgi:uncharacterized protein (TIGR01244 family)